MITFCEAIAKEEGWLIPGSLCRRNNNPGNIEYNRFSVEVLGAIGENEGFSVFSSAQAGFNAESKLLLRDYVGLTVTAAISDWAPPETNNTIIYVENVCSFTGYTPSTILTADMLQAPILGE